MQPRIPEHIRVDVADPELIALIEDASQKLVRAAPQRRVRRLAGLLAEARDKGAPAPVYEFLRRVAQEAILEEANAR